MNIETGDVIRHRWHGNLDEFTWEATVIQVEPETNILKVSIMSIYGQSHPENWNLAHTISGLRDGEYIKHHSSDDNHANSDKNKSRN